MWESPINVMEIQDSFVSEINEKTEEMVFTEIKRMGIDVDKEELIKALMYDREQYEKGYKDGYVDAIDKFREVVGINIIDIFVSDSDYKMADGILKSTAEQLKGEKTMSERTIITTMEVTKIYKDVSEDFENDKTAYGNSMKDRVKKALDADDVVVTNVQEFVLGDEE